MNEEKVQNSAGISLVDLLKKSSLACHLLLGLSFAAGIVFSLMSLVSGILALAVSPQWAWAFILCGLVAGVSIAFGSYIYEEHF